MNDPHTQDLTLLAYFMAHAPAEPQEWFKPNVPAGPVLPKAPSRSSLSLDGIREMEWWRCDSISVDEIKDPTVSAFVKAQIEYKTVAREYMQLLRRESLLQWPRAWARAQCRLHNEALLAMKQEA